MDEFGVIYKVAIGARRVKVKEGREAAVFDPGPMPYVAWSYFYFTGCLFRILIAWQTDDKDLWPKTRKFTHQGRFLSCLWGGAKRNQTNKNSKSIIWWNTSLVYLFFFSLLYIYRSDYFIKSFFPSRCFINNFSFPITLFLK